ncbi:hypothetical protein PTB14_12035 [Enterococcus faecalis]|uniref:hypothetical protein n=1 Tax=Enterococcus faecalis TaxID=1351 RepID=UPI0023623699|nr:hypothetical protein [Enterococcus faecalis]MDD0851143.1 hypothetical protein [Enterococcus faecalis]
MTADFSKAGTYEVTLQTTDGQTQTVKLVIKEKNKAINQNIDKNNHSSRQSKQIILKQIYQVRENKNQIYFML